MGTGAAPARCGWCPSIPKPRVIVPSRCAEVARGSRDRSTTTVMEGGLGASRLRPPLKDSPDATEKHKATVGYSPRPAWPGGRCRCYRVCGRNPTAVLPRRFPLVTRRESIAHHRRLGHQAGQGAPPW